MGRQRAGYVCGRARSTAGRPASRPDQRTDLSNSSRDPCTDRIAHPRDSLECDPRRPSPHRASAAQGRGRRRRPCTRSSPLTSGRRRSSRTIAGGSRSTLAIADAPSPTVSTRYPAPSKMAVIKATLAGSSSTTRILLFATPDLLVTPEAAFVAFRHAAHQHHRRFRRAVQRERRPVDRGITPPSTSSPTTPRAAARASRRSSARPRRETAAACHRSRALHRSRSRARRRSRSRRAASRRTRRGRRLCACSRAMACGRSLAANVALVRADSSPGALGSAAMRPEQLDQRHAA